MIERHQILQMYRILIPSAASYSNIKLDVPVACHNCSIVY